MTLNKAYKVELHPNNRQRDLFERNAAVARFSYNWGLETCINFYKDNKKQLSYFDLHKILCSKKKTDFPWMYGVSKHSPQMALKSVHRAFLNFYIGINKNHNVGYPKFKTKRKSKVSFSFSYDFYVTNNVINIPKIGHVRMKEKGYVPLKNVKIKSVTVTKVSNRWFASVQVEQVSSNKKDLPKNVLGIDVGIKSLSTCSNGQVFENSKSFIKLKKRLAHAQRIMDNKKYDKEIKRSSNNRYKAMLKVQKIHYKIRSRRLDTIHKMTSTLVRTKPRYIVIEDLNVSGMMKNHKLSGSIGDASFYEIKRQLSYKTSWYGGIVIIADKFFPSSKTCCKCGQLKDKLGLDDRTYVCGCGNVMDRDLNAAINLEKYGIDWLESTAGLAGIKACGESVRLVDACMDQKAVSTKQEENMDLVMVQ